MTRVPDLEQLEQDAERRWLAAWLAGTTHIRHDELPLQVGDLAPDLELPDISGGPRRLSDFWAHGPMLLIFMRHFGCSCLAERWEGLRGELDDYAEAGARVAAVCQAEPERAVVDSPWQLPGEFVIASDGRIALAHRYQYCEDFPPKTVLIGAILAAET